ncbi:MAG: MBL fold metallo-hydrolase [Cystobacterineae bacterium]|nr:MBL fold metallo-hydrolase [Cystobacterineae bacterium]
MRIRQFKTVYQLSFMPHIFPINCYFIEEKEDLTLVDTGLAFCCKPILKAASAIGKPIRRIALTHPHAEHTGALDGLKAHIPDATTYISERDSHLMRGDFSLKPGEAQLPIRGRFQKNLKTCADRLLSDADFVGSLKTMLVPGHTPGSMAFYDSRSKTLIAGDALQTRGGVAVSGDTRIFFPFPAAATWNKALAIDSAKKLYALDIQYLATGHGNVIENPSAFIEKAILRAETNL